MRGLLFSLSVWAVIVGGSISLNPMNMNLSDKQGFEKQGSSVPIGDKLGPSDQLPNPGASVPVDKLGPSDQLPNPGPSVVFGDKPGPSIPGGDKVGLSVQLGNPGASVPVGGKVGPSGPSGLPNPSGPPKPSGQLGQSNAGCPEMRTCGITSPLANLICYSSEQKSGFQYAFIGFNEGIVAFASISIDCQAGVVATLNVIAVYGFMFRLTYPIKGYNTNKQGSKLWYLNFGNPGCPSVEEIKYYVYNNMNGQFNDALYPSSIEKNVAIIVYNDLIARNSKYELQCNLFGAPRVTVDTLVTKISLEQINSAILYNVNNRSNGSAIQYINDYGIRGLQCNTSRTPVPGIMPLMYKEVCAATGYDRSPYCRNFQNSPLLSEIVESYGYDRGLEYLDTYEVCKVATLWSQGYYCNGGINDGYPSCPRNSPGGGSFTYMNMAIIPMASNFINFNTPSFPSAFILYYALKGYGPLSIKEDIMKQFIKAC